MNTKGMIAALVTAMVVVTIFAAMISPASAGAADASKEADRAECPIGEDITYTLMINNTDPTESWSFDVFDQYANDAEFQINTVNNLAPGATWSDTITFTLAAGDESPTLPGWVVNNIRYEGFDSAGIPIGSHCGEPVAISIDLSFTYAATDCSEVTVTPTHSGPVAWHQWIINSVPGPVFNTAPFPMTLTSCGSKSVTLKGGADPGNLANYDTFTDTVYVACEPVVKAERTPPTGCVEIGDSVTFSASITTPGTPPYSYLWTFTNGLASSTSPTVARAIPAGGTTATLKVTDDLGCSDTDIVSVSVCPPQKPPSDVPILTPTGIVALIGMMCIVGAGRILTKGRRS